MVSFNFSSIFGNLPSDSCVIIKFEKIQPTASGMVAIPSMKLNCVIADDK